MLKLLYIVALLMCFSSVLPAQNPEQPEQPGEPVEGDAGVPTVRINGIWSEVPVEDMVKLTAELQGLKFLYDPKTLSGTVSIIGPSSGFEIPVGALFSVLQTFLKQQRKILSPFGEDTDQSVKFYEILAAPDAITQSTDVIELDNIDDWTDTSANFVTLVVNLKYADANSVRGALQNLTTRQGGQVNPIPGINSLLVADYSYNIRRLAQIISLMDQPPRSPRLELINVEFIDAEELATSLNNLLTARRQLLQGVPRRPGSPEDETLVSVEVASSMNALMVTGYDAGIELVRDLVSKLDIEIPGASPTGRMHYYQAKNVQAADLEAILSDLLNIGVPGQPGVPGFPGQIGGEDPNAPTIVADENTNSLLVIATPSDYREIRKIIDKLDVRRPQVMIEAAILEVTDSDDFQFGVEIATVDGFAENSDDFRGNFATGFGFSEIVDSSGAPVGVAGGVPAGRAPIFGTGGLFTLNRGGAFDIPLLVRFLKTQSDTNVLQRPMLITNDNETAVMEVQTEIQLVQLNDLGAGSGTTTSGGEFVEAGINMEVTPQISQDGYVTMEVTLDITAFLGESATPGVSPPRSQRLITTFVTVPDQNTVVIGGLKSSESSKTVTKVPFLGDIPLLGELFKSQRTVDRRTNLYIFIRPRILKAADFSDYSALSLEKLDEAEKEVLGTPSNKNFIAGARADFAKVIRVRPGVPDRAFDYQGLDSED